MSDAQGKKQDQFIVRFPDGMRDKIKESAEQNNRSMNAEMIAALEGWLAKSAKEEIEAQNLRDTAKHMMLERSMIEHRLTEILSRIEDMDASKAMRDEDQES